jgi:hypothetical protein
MKADERPGGERNGDKGLNESDGGRGFNGSASGKERLSVLSYETPGRRERETRSGGTRESAVPFDPGPAVVDVVGHCHLPDRVSKIRFRPVPPLEISVHSKVSVRNEVGKDRGESECMTMSFSVVMDKLPFFAGLPNRRHGIRRIACSV